MKQISFDINLRQPLIISQHAASAGAHESLDFIPGSVMLGLIASRLYVGLGSEDAWTVFHSGLVRFGDALPLLGQEVAYAAPLCWHSFKGEKNQDEEGRLLEGMVFDASRKTKEESGTRQPVQIRNCHVTASGISFSPARQQTLKTAIDASTGVAAESQLFGYEALAAGQQFRFTLSADAGVSDKLWTALGHALEGEARLGRSRSAQFGSVTIHKAAGQKAAFMSPAGNGRELTLWLVSDLLLQQQGQPCLIPHPELLGLPQGTVWDKAASFVRTRRYSPYNTFRKHYDPERQVISRGSVLRFTLPAPADAALLQQLSQGLGLARESGLGQVWVNPGLLSHTEPVFDKPARQPDAVAPKDVTEPDTPLVRLLGRHFKGEELRDGPASVAEEIFVGLCARIREARSYVAVPANTLLEGAPGRSQFGRIKELASSHRGQPGVLWTALSNPNDGILRHRGDKKLWELSYGQNPEHKLGNWLRLELDKYDEESWFPALVGQLAVRGLTDDWTDCCEGKKREK